MTMLQVLKEICSLLASSEESDWASLTPQEVGERVSREICSLEKDGRIQDRDELICLFAPTGDMQEIAMVNGWHDQYMSLSSQFDQEILRYK